jgi:hypothetical protein
MMKRFAVVLILLFLYISSSCAEISTGKTPLDTVRYLLIHQEYKSASEVVSRYLKEKPNDIEALYLLLATDQTRILDYESYYLNGPMFLAAADSVRLIYEKQLRSARGRDSVMCLFYLANVYGGISIIQAKTGKWLDGMRNGLTSVSMFKEVRKRCPEFYAAYFGIGVFNYYFNRNLKWIPFSESKCQEGMAYIETALNADFPFNHAAKNMLCWILIDRKEYRRADSLANSVLADYPDNTIFLRIKTMIALWSNDYQSAVRLSLNFIQLTQDRVPLNWSDLVSGYDVLVESYNKLGMKCESKEAAETILGKTIPSDFLSIPQIKSNLKMISDIKQTLSSR